MHEPARSGIQRVIKEFSNIAKDRDLEYRFLSIHTTRPEFISAAQFNRIMENYWLNIIQGASDLQNAFNETSENVFFNPVENNFYLRIEPSFNKRIIDYFMELPSFVKCVSVVYDAFPALKPEYYLGNGLSVNSYYFRSLLKRQDIITNSKNTMIQIETQLRNGNTGLGKIEVVPLGSDHIKLKKSSREFESTPEIVMLGTLEPRKNHHIALESIRLLNQFGTKFRLTFLGAESAHNIDFCNELRKESSSWFDWCSNLLDSEIEGKLENASILIQLGEEGFGIPVLEAYAKGCVVVFAGTQPAAELLKTNGVIKLSKISVEALSDALEALWIDNYHGIILSSELNCCFQIKIRQQIITVSRFRFLKDTKLLDLKI